MARPLLGLWPLGHVERFEPKLPDLDAAVNALAKCNRDTWDASRSFSDGGNQRLSEPDVQRLLDHVERALQAPGGLAEDPVKQFTTMAWARDPRGAREAPERPKT